MSRTFEEMASQELDSLYQGALFLSGGVARIAGKLLVAAMTTSFREREEDMPNAAVERWLEERLVQQFLVDEELGPGRVRGAHEGKARGAFDGLEADTLFAAAAVLPPWARAAVWLVLLRRWSYGEACEALDVDVDVLQDLLGYRDRLMIEILRASRRGNGTDGAGM